LSTSDPGREALHTKVDALGLQEVAVVNEFVDALLAPVEAKLLVGSWLTTAEWAEAFLARLRAHHALSREPLSTTQFEAAFENACEAAGWTVESSTSATQRFFDTKVTLPGNTAKRISLKASSARGMSRTSVHISKLTEAAWIQDVRKQADRRDKIVELFKEYRSSTDGVVMLRGFEEANGVFYELVEIPTTLFASVDNLDIPTAQLATIPVPPNATGTPDLKIRIDRSDAKITLTAIQLSVVVVHGQWTLEAQN
jgi:hypothetical protein